MSNSNYVYFMRQVGGIGPIKIGCSGMLPDRLEAMATWSPVPLEILATVPGDFDLERNLHNCFWDLYSHHEWFRPEPRLLAVIEKLQAGTPLHEAMDLNARVSHKSRKEQHWARNPEGRQRASYAHRINWACKKAAGPLSARYFPTPDEVEAIMVRWRGYGHGYRGMPITPTAAEFDLMERFIAEPVEYAAAQKRAA